MDNDDDSEPTEEDIGISLAALTGINTVDTLRLSVVVAGVQLQALVDTRSTHTFIHEDVARRLGLPMEYWPGISVKVANGERVTSSGCAKEQRLTLAGTLSSLIVSLLD